jgi:hypothetical protein
MRPATAAERHPALDILSFGRWDDAFGALHVRVDRMLGEDRAQRLFDVIADRKAIKAEISDLIEELYAIGKPSAGSLALAWEMLTADPRKPASLYFLPQLQFVLNQADLEANDDSELRRRLRVWWEAADGLHLTAKVSLFRLADPEAECWPEEPDVITLLRERTSTSATLFADLGLPTLVVMPKDKSSKLNNYHGAFKDLIGAAMPLVVVRDLQRTSRRGFARWCWSDRREPARAVSCGAWPTWSASMSTGSTGRHRPTTNSAAPPRHGRIPKSRCRRARSLSRGRRTRWC